MNDDQQPVNVVLFALLWGTSIGLLIGMTPGFIALVRDVFKGLLP